jgi:hypothetical protein
LGIRIVTGAVCSKASGIERRRMRMVNRAGMKW